MAKIYGATVATPINPNKLKGDDGITPHINEEGFWCIGNVNTGVKAAGTPGLPGNPGLPGQDGDNGITPHIGDNGNWYIGETDTGIKATGRDGGYYVPAITESGNDLHFTFTPTKEDMGDALAFVLPKPRDGQDGKDGTSPVVVVSPIDGGHRVVVVTAAGAKTFDVMDGKDGEDGTSPSVVVVPVDGGHRVSVVTAAGTQNFFVMDGKDGKDGQPGAKGEKGDKGDPGEKGDTGVQGIQGIQGEKGDTGATGPEGPKGDQGIQGEQGPKGDKGDTGATGPEGPQGPKGDKGDTGAAGADGAKGEKGDKGDKGDTGATGATGAAGKDGYTPQKGVDYGTEADKAEIVREVIENLGGTPVFGYVDENNYITLKGNLPEDKNYTFGYVTGNGSIIDIGKAEFVTDAKYTNQIPISTDTDGNVYGFSSNTYLGSSNGAISTKTGIFTTGFIPCKVDDVIRFEGLSFKQNATNANYHRVVIYDSSRSFLAFFNANGVAQVRNLEQDADGTWKKFQIGAANTNAAFIRVCCEGMSESSIITINEEIV